MVPKGEPAEIEREALEAFQTGRDGADAWGRKPLGKEAHEFLLPMPKTKPPGRALSITHIFSPHNDAQLDVDKAG